MADIYSQQQRVVTLLLILLLAAVVRLPFMLDPGLTGDEVNYIMIARCGLSDILFGKALDPSNPPLYMALLHGIMTPAGERVWVWKLGSVLCNMGFIVLLMTLSRRWVDNKTAVLAGLLAAIHPWQVYLGTEVRGYALAALLAMLVIAGADGYQRRHRLGWLGLWVLASVAGFLTHYSVVGVSMVTGLYLLWTVRHDRRQAARVCIAGAVAAALCGLWLPLLVSQPMNLGGSAENVWHLAGLFVVQTLGTTYLRPALPIFWLVAGGVLALLVFAAPLVSGFFALWKTNQRTALMTALLFIVAILLPLTRSLFIGSLSFSTRYTFVANMCILLCLAAGLARWQRPLRLAFLGGIVALSAVSLYQFKYVYVGRSDPAAIYERIGRCVTVDDAIVLPRIHLAMHAEYFAEGQLANLFIVREGRPGCWPVPSGANWVDICQAQNAPDRHFTATGCEQLRKHDRVWCWQFGKQEDLPEMLDQRYALDQRHVISPGGQFGAETVIYLTRYTRLP
ncbi:MAG: hypothetical protein GXY44_00890 [Phycisphaerales bacterium]|nr:hypothetical protein [Phycisphaerales bacterium]